MVAVKVQISDISTVLPGPIYQKQGLVRAALSASWIKAAFLFKWANKMLVRVDKTRML